MPEISQSTKTLIQRYQAWYQSRQPKEGVSTIHVDEVASRVAAFYEKIRGVIDWKEEHLFRKGAIERNLKRRLLLLNNGGQIAEPLILELIRGGHFPNDRIEESKIEDVQKLINKYIYILRNSPTLPKAKLKIQLDNWILEIAACEVEEVLSPPIKENALIDYMTELMKERIELKGSLRISEEEKNTQIYIAVQRALFNLDSSTISYNLLKKLYPKWQNFSSEELKEITENIYSIWDSIENDLNHPLADKFYKVCERYDTPYLILGDIISEEPMKIGEKISQPELLENSIRQAYQRRAATIKSRLNRAAFFATLSIFVSNVFVLYAVEVPLAKLVWGYFTPLAIAIDVLGPTFLMFFLIATIRLPKRENINIAVMEVMKIAYEEKKKDVYEIKFLLKRGFFVRAFIVLSYLACFGLFCFGINQGLSKIHLPITSHLVFIIFISLIAFAGLKIRRRVKELEVIEEKESIFFFLVDLVAVPTTQLGKWISGRWKKLNVVSKFFSYLIDMPFQLFVEFLEQWRYFLKEKKEEIH